jgi:ATP-binding cassette, subfamily B, bacterial
MKDIVKIIRYSWVLKRYYLVTAVFIVIIALLNQATPFIFKFIVDGIVAHLNGEPVSGRFIAVLVCLIFAANLAVTFLENIQGYIGDRLGVKLYTLLAQRYYDHLLKLPMSYFDNEITGRITSRLDRSVATIGQLVQAFANNFIGFFLTSAFTLMIMAYYSWPTAVLLALLFPAYIWLTTLSSRSWQAKQQGINQDIDYSQGRFVEAIGAIKVVKSFVQETVESKLFASKRRTIEDQTYAQSKQWHYYDVLRRLGLNTVFFLIYAFIVWQTYRGHYSLGTMTLLLQLAVQAQFPLFASSFIVDNLQRAVAGSRDYFEVMETIPAISDPPGAREMKVSRGLIEYKKVNFSYNDSQRVLNDISFKIEPGCKVALVGESGEGKTTIANLLLRFYEPSSGSISIDGQKISEVTQSSLRRNIGVVFQEPTLFSGTVAQNISYGQASVSPDELAEAARAANAWDFIQKLPQGFDTEIGERGVKLSGGQKQRLAIARAILKDAPILILDEATSSLDSRAEQEVQAALERLMENRTTMIIAHRLSTIASVDTIISLQGGRVVEIGSPAELAEGQGIYAQLLRLQQPTKANRAKLKQYDIARI